MIAVEQLGKSYKRYPDRWGRLAEWLSGGTVVRHEARWALREVSFEVAPGEAVAIIGRNGAGKTTLLKILTGTTHPTEGHFRIDGRVAALLELGLGFHPDFTGTQNAIMGCQMFGLAPAEIHHLLPEVTDFAELDDYMEQPLRSYSTGMQMRLAFAVATAVRPEVLIVDEALSVGDAYFQHKSFKRIRSFREAGTTLLFVSHDPAAVKSLCDRALLLEQGRLIRSGAPGAVLDYYNALIAQQEAADAIVQVEAERGRTVTRSGDGRARLVTVELTDSAGNPARTFRAGAQALVRCTVAFHATVEQPTIGLLIRDRLGNDVFGTNTFHLNAAEPVLHAGETLTATFDLRLDIGYGSYSVTAAVHARDSHLADSYDWWDGALVFEIIPDDSYRFVGTARLPVAVRLQRAASSDPGANSGERQR